MPISPLTQMSLVASVNLHRLRESFSDLRDSHGFYVDAGSWCCNRCAGNYAWEVAEGRPFVFWHEQSEDNAHLYRTSTMPLSFGVANQDSTDADVIAIARTIIEVLAKHELICDWPDGDVKSSIKVHLDKHEPSLAVGEDKDDDQQEVAFYLPENEETKDFCWNPSDEDSDELVGCFSFDKTIQDGESLRDVFLRIDPSVRQHITHFQRFFFKASNCTQYPVESILEIDNCFGHCGPSLIDDFLEDQDDEEEDDEEDE